MQLKNVFNLPPQEALAYWRTKTPVTAEEYAKLGAAAKERAFVVAGLTRQDQAAALHASLLKAIDEGKTIGAWRKEVAALAEEAGLSRARLNTIFRTNLQTAYMAGRYQAMMKNTDDRPYWRYLAVMDMRTRPSHAALNGKIYRYDDPFWARFYPPNGFNCRCSVQALSERDIEEQGLTVEEGAPGPTIPAARWPGRCTPTAFGRRIPSTTGRC